MSIILREAFTYDQAQVIYEATEGKDGQGKNLFMKGIFVQGGVRNLNERVYPVHEIENAVGQVNEILRKG